MGSGSSATERAAEATALPEGAILLNGVSRRFRVVHDRNPTLKESLIRRRRSAFTELWALRDVDLEVEPGEAIGIVGRNGSGKSTLLKVLAGIIPPHSGTVTTAGSMASLLELGSGFHPDFTGRENVFMNGAIHGLTQRDVADRIDDIVDFSEVGDFIDMPVRTYSSGMQMRLAFAVASHLNPDILLLDEVLAVGDEAFQRKCMGRMAGFLRGGGTLVFVSHDPSSVERICSRAILLDQGVVVADAPPSEVVRAYHRDLAVAPRRTGATSPEPPPDGVAADANSEGDPAQDPNASELIDTDTSGGSDEKRHPSPLGGWGSGTAWIERITVTGPDGGTGTVVSGDPITICLEIHASEPIHQPNIGVGINSGFDGTVLYGTNTDLAGLETGPLLSSVYATCNIPALHLREGRFSISASVISADGDDVYHWVDDVAWVDVLPQSPGAGIVALNADWRLTVSLDDPAL